MHLFKQQAVKDPESVSELIPVIDFGPYFAGEAGALDRLAEHLRHACENIGFFYAANHGVPQAVIDRAFAASRRFHALPLEEKLKLRLNESNIGYLPMNASVQGASTVHKATKPNQNESFFISHDRGADHPDVIAGIPLRGRNQWPDGMPSLREDMMDYFHALSGMCERMLPGFAVAVDMPPDTFAPFFANEAHINLRFLHYPPQEDTSENTFGTAPHTDNSFMTALARTDVPGLAIRLPSGEWFATRGDQRVGHRPLLHRVFPQPEPVFNDRMPAKLRVGGQSSAVSAGRLSGSGVGILPQELFSSERTPVGGGPTGQRLITPGARQSDTASERPGRPAGTPWRRA
jgi:isopenicillin N synthase-like dioxygenase